MTNIDYDPAKDLFEYNSEKFEKLLKMAAEFEMDVYPFSDTSRIPEEVIGMLPGVIAKRYKVIPVWYDKKENILTVATADPVDLDAIDAIRYIMKMNVHALLADRERLEAAIEEYYHDDDVTGFHCKENNFTCPCGESFPLRFNDETRCPNCGCVFNLCGWNPNKNGFLRN